MERREVAVIGAGPGGSAAARAAALAGVAPLLVERDPTPGATSACGGFAGHALRRKLDLPDDVVEREITRTVLTIDGQPFVYGGRKPHYVSFRRSRFDTYLAQRAVKAGAELATSTRATVLDASARRLGLKDLRTGAEREVEADIVIFADGPATLAASAFGIGHKPGPRTRNAIFCELEGAYGDGQTADIVLNTAYTKSYFWLFPKRDCVWVGVGGSLTGGGPPLNERLSAFIEGHDALRGRAVRHQGAGLVPCDVAAEFVCDGAMVVGDAAGLVNPMTGGGIAFALVSGEIAGRVAAEAVRARRADGAFLRRYPRRFRRTPHHLWLTAMAWWRRRLDRLPPAEQPLAYARMLRRYLSFFHHAHVLADLVLGRREA